jgi:hypothetical protein
VIQLEQQQQQQQQQQVDTGPNDEDVHQKYKKDTNEHH